MACFLKLCSCFVIVKAKPMSSYMGPFPSVQVPEISKAGGCAKKASYSDTKEEPEALAEVQVSRLQTCSTARQRGRRFCTDEEEPGTLTNLTNPY
jgi:hypothetical protein